MNRMMLTRNLKIGAWLALALACAGAAGTGSAAVADEGGRWDSEVKALIETLPVQDGGRVKPLDTLAQFKMLKLHGKRSMTLPGTDGTPERKIDSTEWLLDCLFHPDEASDYPTFIVDNSDVIVALGLEPHTNETSGRAELRGRYSYNELLPARSRLYELGQEYSAIKEKDRDIIQRMVVDLSSNVSDFEYLINAFKFAREPIAFTGEGLPDALTGGQANVSWRSSDVLDKIDELRELGSSGNLPDSLREALTQFEFLARSAVAIPLFPPPPTALGETPPAEAKWLSPGEVLLGAFESESNRGWALPRVRMLEELSDAVGDAGAFKAALSALHGKVVGEARGLGLYGEIEREVRFYDRDYFTNALAWFLLVFFVSAFAWFSPGSRWGTWVNRVAMVMMVVPSWYLIAGIWQRCLIRDRPPVSTLYETILFIAAVIAVVALAIEVITRRKIALPVGAFLGALGMFLSIKYEHKEAVDTMPSLVAVLDTNFWLSTHVTTVTAGYAAGLFAMGLSVVYLVARTIEWLVVRKAESRERLAAVNRTVTRITYGVICFGLLFALVGTVLGGIWANYSWGRFWGWDPKENGALMIVLWMLAILHARMGGYIREFGLHLASLFLGMVVAFSWWHVNLLEVGLHSYGFTSGLKTILFAFYGIVLLLIGWGFVLRLLLRRAERLARTTAREPRKKAGVAGSKQPPIEGAAPTPN